MNKGMPHNNPPLNNPPLKGRFIFDAHAHLFSRQFYALLWKQKHGNLPGPADLAGMLAGLGLELPPEDPAEHAARWINEMDAHGISRLLLFTSLPGEQAAVAAAVSAFPQRLSGFTLVDPRAPGALENARRDTSELRLRGIELFPAMHRFDPSDEACVYPFYALAQELDVPVFCHMGILRVKLREKLGLPSRFDMRFSNPVLLHRAAADHPKVRFILPHFGCGYLNEALFVGSLCQNVFIDTSSSNEWMSLLTEPLSLARALELCLKVFGSERILFGTDSSTLPRGYRRDNMDALLAAFETLKVGATEREKIMGLNLAALLKIEAP